MRARVNARSPDTRREFSYPPLVTRRVSPNDWQRRLNDVPDVDPARSRARRAERARSMTPAFLVIAEISLTAHATCDTRITYRLSTSVETCDFARPCPPCRLPSLSSHPLTPVEEQRGNRAPLTSSTPSNGKVSRTRDIVRATTTTARISGFARGCIPRGARHRGKNPTTWNKFRFHSAELPEVDVQADTADVGARNLNFRCDAERRTNGCHPLLIR